jgi:hypothetical protein
MECTVLAGVPLSPEQARALHAAIDDNLQHPAEAIRAAAAAALHAFARAHLAGACLTYHTHPSCYH